MTNYPNPNPTEFTPEIVDSIVKSYETNTLKDVAAEHGTYPGKVRETLVGQNVRIRSRGETPPGYKVSETMTVDLTSANDNKSEGILVADRKDLLKDLLRNGHVTQADIDKLATKTKVTPAQKSKVPTCKADAAKAIDALAEKFGGHVTGRIRGEIFGHTGPYYPK